MGCLFLYIFLLCCVLFREYWLTISQVIELSSSYGFEDLYYLYNMLKRACGQETHPPPDNMSLLNNRVLKCQRVLNCHIIAFSGLVAQLGHHFRVTHDESDAFPIQTLDLETLQGVSFIFPNSNGGIKCMVGRLTPVLLTSQQRSHKHLRQSQLLPTHPRGGV